jgi:hypothetical protein
VEIEGELPPDPPLVAESVVKLNLKSPVPKKFPWKWIAAVAAVCLVLVVVRAISSRGNRGNSVGVVPAPPSGSGTPVALLLLAAPVDSWPLARLWVHASAG